MSKQLRVNIFQVHRTDKTQPLSETLREFHALPLPERWRDEMRLEDASFESAAAGVLPYDAYYFEISKRRSTGPGRLSAAHPLESIDLGAGGRFGEETSALYVPRKEWLLVLNNHYGVGPSRMATYFNALDPGRADRYFDYSFEPMIDHKTMERLKSMRRLSELEISATVGVFEGLQTPLSESLLDAASGTNAVRLSLRLNANPKRKRGESLNPTAVRQFIKKLLPQSDEIDRLVIKGDEEVLEAKDRFVDLLHHKLFKKFGEADLQIEDGRYTRQSKLSLLSKSLRGWARDLD